MITGHAIMWYVTLKTNSGTIMTLFTVATMLPMFFIAPFGGVWADRFNRKNLINIADAGIATVTLVIALLFSVGITNTALLFFCSIARSLGQGVQMPAVSALIPQIVPQAHLARINGFNSSIQSLALLASPPIAGALLTFAPIQILLFIDVVTAVIGISILFFFVKVPGLKCVADFGTEENPEDDEGAEKSIAPVKGNAQNVATEIENDRAHTAAATMQPVGDSAQNVAAADARSYFHDIKEGIRYVYHHQFIKRFFLCFAIFSVLLTPAALLTPLQVSRDFGADVWRLTAIELVWAAGMMVGGILMGLWGGFKNKTFTLFFGCLLFAIETIGLGILANFVLYLICMGLMGLAVPVISAPVTTILQMKIDPEYMGRAFSVNTMISALAMPIGMLVFGPVSDAIAIDWLLIGTGIGVAGLGVYMIADRVIREAGK